MKRKLSNECDYFKTSTIYPDVSIIATTLKQKKIQRSGAVRVPSVISESRFCSPIDPTVCQRIRSIFHEDDSMGVDESKGLAYGGPLFLFFLGAQGKEFIDHIRSNFPVNFNSVAFISSNLEESQYSEWSDPTLYLSNSKSCVSLSTYFGINDPLGGGSYPLNFLIVIDANHCQRCRIPIRIGRGCSPHEKFGINLDQLSGLVVDILEYSNSL